MELEVLSNFSKDFLDIYLRGGLGSLSKKDTESLIVWLIVENQPSFRFNDGKLDYTQLSLALKIPSKRVIELLNHARLRFESVDLSPKALLAHLSNALLKTAYIKDGETVKFSIHDALVREALENEVRKRDGIFENFFNKENISVNVSTLGIIISELCSEEQWKKINQKQQSHLSKKEFFIDVLEKFANSAADEGGKLLARGVAGILTGGLSEVLEYLKS